MDQGGATSAPPPSEPPPRALEGPRHAADAIYGADAMAAARDELAVMDDFTLATIMLERFEARLGDRSEEHTSELQSLMRISYAVFCLKKKPKNKRKAVHRNNK